MIEISYPCVLGNMLYTNICANGRIFVHTHKKIYVKDNYKLLYYSLLRLQKVN